VKLTDQVKNDIDLLSYPELLEKWRKAPVGCEILQGESAVYFAKRMEAKREQEDDDGAAASKALGWN